MCRMSNEQQNNEQQQQNVQDNNNTQQQNNAQQNVEQAVNQAKNFLATPLGQKVAGAVVAVIVLGAIVGFSRSGSPTKEQHNQVQQMLSKQCQLFSSPAQKKANGMECVSANLSDNNKDITLTYRVLRDDIVEGMKANEDAAGVIKGNFCAQPQMKKMLKSVDSVSMIYLDPSDKELVSVKITGC